MIVLGAVLLVLALVASLFADGWRHPVVKLCAAVGVVLLAVGVILTAGHHTTY